MNKCIKMIPRDINISKHTVVCELYFEKYFINEFLDICNFL